jgi:hypothetical protein
MFRRAKVAVVIAAFAMLTFATSAHAAFIGAGQSAPPDAFAGGPIGSALGSASGPWSFGTTSGTYTAQVFSGYTTLLTSGFAFVYTVTQNPVGVSSGLFTRTEMANFTGFLADAGFDAVSAGISPTTMDRSLDSCTSMNLSCGSIVGFNFFTPAVGPGQQTKTLVIGTDAKNFSSGILRIGNGNTPAGSFVGTGNLAAFQPAAGVFSVAEPSSVLLLSSGLMGLGLLVHRRIKRMGLNN